MSGFAVLVWLLVAFALGFFVAVSLRSRSRAAAKPDTAPTQGELTPPPEPEQPAAETGNAGGLNARLMVLRQKIDGLSENAAHPRELVEHEDFKSAVALLSDPAVPADTVIEYALDTHWAISSVALVALTQRNEHEAALAAILPRFARISPWPLHFALALIEGAPQRPPLGAPLLQAHEYSAKHGLVPDMYLAHFRRREALGDEPTFGAALTGDVNPGEHVGELLEKIGHRFAKSLLAELDAWRARRVDADFLQGIGRLWSAEPDPQLIEYPAIADPLQTIETALTHTPARSVLIIGEPRVGKSALARLAGARLARQGYTVFEASGPELQAGQKYIGELEGRIRKLIGELAVGKRVVWYVPDFLQIVFSGTHSGQTASIFDQLLPDLTADRLVMLSECTPGGLTRAQQYRPQLRNVFDLVRLRPVTPEDAAGVVEEYLERVAKLVKIGIEPGVGGSVTQLARHYLGGLQAPGAELDLIKLASNRAVANNEGTLTRDGLLTTLAQITGLPRAVLDDSEKMELAQIRDFFGARVIGQEEAVNSVVDRIAMFKAGLTDPARPIGVFLFAGPTGTGKTELAKTLAEYLFGTADRLIRLDMSEFQHSGSVDKIIGAGGVADAEGQSLIQRVRKQPFAVILLDEFEKAHSNIWDLFLQVFDDGRLTDTAGQTADFRHTLIILTSNLGATAHQSAGVGFAPRSDAFSQAQVQRAVAQSFRPEFVNRLDKVIVFKPLTRDRMRSILRKELTRVLERRGLKNREWAVEWESSALEFLLEKGFTADMGARPLKRAIDQHLLAPLAATLVERRFPVGDQFLFVRSDGESIQVEFVDPDAGSGAGSAPAAPAAAAAEISPTAVASAVLQPAGTRAEREQLTAALAGIDRELAGGEWEALREKLTSRMSATDFWDRDDRQRVLARYALLDRVKAAAATARSLSERHGRGLPDRAGQYSRELASRLALQLLLVERGLRDVLADAPIEVVLLVETAMDSGGDAEAARRWCARVHDMYQGWGAARRMQLTPRELAGGRALVIAGFGAHAVLSRECGLHVLESGEARRSVARVRVAPLWTSEPAESIAVMALEQALAGVGAASAIVRRYRIEPSPLVRDAERGWRTGRLDDVLAGNFDVFTSG
jgi:ATP-dependent Clp protease ATP-binding subunit ClpC